MKYLIEMKNVSTIFNKGKINECIALDNINLNIKRGDYITIWGGNGAGKSSLLSAIADGQISSGHIFLNGNEITKLPSYKKARLISQVTQNVFDMLSETLTLEEHLAVSIIKDKKRTFKKGVTSKLRNRIQSKIAELNLGLENRLNEKLINFSGGERQAIALVMATMTLPEILLLDEHTAALDLEKTKLIEDLTNNLVNKHKITTLWVTHKKEQAARYGERILFMNKGKIIKDLESLEKKSYDYENLIITLEKFQMKNNLDTNNEL